MQTDVLLHIHSFLDLSSSFALASSSHFQASIPRTFPRCFWSQMHERTLNKMEVFFVEACRSNNQCLIDLGWTLVSDETRCKGLREVLMYDDPSCLKGLPIGLCAKEAKIVLASGMPRVLMHAIRERPSTYYLKRKAPLFAILSATSEGWILLQDLFKFCDLQDLKCEMAMLKHCWHPKAPKIGIRMTIHHEVIHPIFLLRLAKIFVEHVGVPPPGRYFSYYYIDQWEWMARKKGLVKLANYLKLKIKAWNLRQKS